MTRAPRTPTDKLQREMHPGEPAYVAATRRAALVPQLPQVAEDAYLARQKRMRLATWGATVVVAAAASFAVLFALPSPAPRTLVLALAGTVEIIHGESEWQAPLREAVQATSSDEVRTADGASASASLASGAEVEIGSGSRVRISGAARSSPTRDEAVDLASGRVRVRVPKLGAARSFAVRTPDTTVVVHGTVFSVERRPGLAGSAPITRVEVEEGRVAVRHGDTEFFLTAGERWSSEEAPSLDGSAGSAADDDVDDALEGSTSQRAPFGQGKRNTLAAENRLLNGAITARQQGHAERALSSIDRLLRLYPGSTLAEEARVERMRAILAAEGPASAAREARRYLSDYPHGFARDEAFKVTGDVR